MAKSKTRLGEQTYDLFDIASAADEQGPVREPRPVFDGVTPPEPQEEAAGASPVEVQPVARLIETEGMALPDRLDFLTDPAGWEKVVNSLLPNLPASLKPIIPDLPPDYRRPFASGTLTSQDHASVPVTTDILSLKTATKVGKSLKNSGAGRPQITVSSPIGTQERALWACLLHHAYPNLNKQFAFRAKLHDLSMALSNRMVMDKQGNVVRSVKDKIRNNERIWESVKSLMQTVLEVDDVRAGKSRIRHATPLLGESVIEEDTETGEGVLVYTLPLGIMLLLANPRAFSDVRLRIMNSFSSTYAQNLYIILQRLADLGEIERPWCVRVEDIRNELDVPAGAYPNFSNLRTKVLLPAVEQINAFTEFDVVMTEIKAKTRGEPVVELRFAIKRKAGPSPYEQLYLNGTTKEDRVRIVSERKRSKSASSRAGAGKRGVAKPIAAPAGESVTATGPEAAKRTGRRVSKFKPQD